MRHSDSHGWFVLFWIVAGIFWLGLEIGQWVWWLSGALVLAYFLYATFKARQIRLAPCQHGTAGANRNRELCDQCKAEDDAKRKADEEKRRTERGNEYRRYLRNIRLPSYIQEMDPLCEGGQAGVSH